MGSGHRRYPFGLRKWVSRQVPPIHHPFGRLDLPWDGILLRRYLLVSDTDYCLQKVDTLYPLPIYQFITMKHPPLG